MLRQLEAWYILSTQEGELQFFCLFGKSLTILSILCFRCYPSNDMAQVDVAKLMLCLGMGKVAQNLFAQVFLKTRLMKSSACSTYLYHDKNQIIACVSSM